MSAFDSQKFLLAVRRRPKRVKGPSEQRRLQRRLEERKRARDFAPVAAPIESPSPSVEPSDKPSKFSFLARPRMTRDQRRAKCKAKRDHKVKRKLRERQRMAARSGLPELVRRGPARPEGGGKAGAPGPEAAKGGGEGAGFTCIAGSPRTTEKLDALSQDGRWKNPQHESEGGCDDG